MRKILVIGAHPDDADVSCCGLLCKLKEAGWDIRLLSVTDGGAGTLGIGVTREQVSTIRREEARRSGERFGGRYDVLSFPDGCLEPTLAAREEVIRYIRKYKPDVIITNRPCDYHPDHRATSTLVQDASYMLIVPFVCPDTKSLDYVPAILYWHDSFKHPYPFVNEILVPLKESRVDEQTAVASCHESQYFDWLCFPDHMEVRDWPREKQTVYLRKRYAEQYDCLRTEADEELYARFGDAAAKITYVETYEVCEYGGEVPEDFLAIAESPE